MSVVTPFQPLIFLLVFMNYVTKRPIICTLGPRLKQRSGRRNKNASSSGAPGEAKTPQAAKRQAKQKRLKQRSGRQHVTPKRSVLTVASSLILWVSTGSFSQSQSTERCAAADLSSAPLLQPHDGPSVDTPRHTPEASRRRQPPA